MIPFTEHLKACKTITLYCLGIYMYIYMKRKQIHGNKHQIQNCGYLCKGGRECDEGDFHGRLQLYMKSFYLLIHGYMNGNITSYSFGVS